MADSRFVARVGHEFVLNVEVVPPAEGACEGLVGRIASSVRDLPVDAVNLADSPMACPKMSPVLFAGALRAELPAGMEIIPHITVRDRNRVALQGLLWGAAATGIRAVLIVSGDPVHFSSDPQTRLVADLSVPDLVRLACQVGLRAGVVFDARPAQRGLELRKLGRKVEAGASFVITQPLFVPEDIEKLGRDLSGCGAPALLGILPLVSLRHARFLDERVPGVDVPGALIGQLEMAGDGALAVGIANARAMLAAARLALAGACIMPPFHRFSLVPDIVL